jgi:Protein of unknown function (DUF3617)
VREWLCATQQPTGAPVPLRHAVSLAISLMVLMPPAARAAERLQPGLWEVTASVELPGVPAPSLTTQTECLSQKDVDADPVPELDKGACRASQIRRSGDQVTWKLDCGPLGRGEGQVVYKSSTAYEGWMTLSSAGTALRTTIRARRVGECPHADRRPVPAGHGEPAA